MTKLVHGIVECPSLSDVYLLRFTKRMQSRSKHFISKFMVYLDDWEVWMSQKFIGDNVLLV